ncbi:14635_t:CDS:1, partial [Racocetra fulgida]
GDSFLYEILHGEYSVGAGFISICSKVKCPTREFDIPPFGDNVDNSTTLSIKFKITSSTTIKVCALIVPNIDD